MKQMRTISILVFFIAATAAAATLMGILSRFLTSLL
ncbi:MAG: hypothetical protein A4E53_03454 [Pelotomaculum sp. PtaB.Bin104]|nr:MAG: hypothetical protein A4E53_03454 [Pelotomaculum sp. PtaB.Bin104]